jgi:hypothetical protein
MPRVHPIGKRSGPRSVSTARAVVLPPGTNLICSAPHQVSETKTMSE